MAILCRSVTYTSLVGSLTFLSYDPAASPPTFLYDSAMVVSTEGFSDHFQRNTSRGIELTHHHLMSTCSGTLPLKPLHMCAFCWDLTLWFCGLGFWVWSWKGRLRNMAMATKGAMGVALAVVIALSIVLTVLADGECSVDSPCRDENNCCSQFGFCGTGETHCGNDCQAGPCTGETAPSAASVGAGLGDILTRDLYEQFFPGHLSFYSYDQLIEAAKLFPQFGTTGDTDTRKREIAAFAAHVTQETSGLTKIVEDTNDTYCDTKRPEFPCGDKKFNGRGPLQLSWNFNYGPCGTYLNIDLLGNPDLVATDPLISFKASLWFWNQYGDNVIPHMHDVIVGNWKPSDADQAANRVPGFGVTIVIINGGLECNQQSAGADNRVRYFKDFCSRLNISPGDNLDCKTMRPFYSVNLSGVS